MPSRGAKPIWTPSVGGSASSMAQLSSITVSMAWLGRKNPPFSFPSSLEYPTNAERDPPGKSEFLPSLCTYLCLLILVQGVPGHLCLELIWQSLIKGLHVTDFCSQGLRGPPWKMETQVCLSP